MVEALAPVAPEGLAFARQLTERLADFIARALGQSLDVASEMAADTLRYKQWERLARFLDRATEFNNQRQRQGRPRLVLPKFLLPIIENASLEEDDDLQDLWAKLFAAGADPDRPTLRMAFVDIVKQLEKMDARVLQLLLESSEKEGADPAGSRVASDYIKQCLGLNETEYRIAIDNLIRLRCVMFYVEERELEIPRPIYVGTETDFQQDREPITYDHGYDSVCLTELGLALIEACAAPRQGSKGSTEND